MGQIIISNPTSHRIAIGRVDVTRNAGAVVDAINLPPGNTVEDEAKLKRVLKGCPKSAKHFGKETPVGSRCSYTKVKAKPKAKPPTEATEPTEPTAPVGLPDTIENLDLAVALGLIARCDTLDRLNAWATPAILAVPELTDALNARFHELGA